MTKTNLAKKTKFFIFSIKRNLSSITFSCLVLFIMFLIISNPALFSGSTISGIKLFFYSVLPGLFPFMFLTKVLTEIGTVFKVSNKLNNVSNKLFGTPGVSLYCFAMSILSGYPIGAKIISDLYQKNMITQKDAKKMSIFCTTSGPIFVIGAVGVGMLKSFKYGVIIYISHILSSIISGFVYNILSKSKTEKQEKIFTPVSPKENIFANCLNDTIVSLFLVGGYITIFYLLTEILNLLGIVTFLSKTLENCFSKLNLSSINFKGLIYGLVEVTHGIKEISSGQIVSIPLICGLISFSGASIIMQSMSFLKTTQIKTHTFIFSKCVQMILSIILCKIIITIL